jgi:hypothetical protein
MHTIYRKTPLGVAEIESRALKIPQRLRSLLIMIDGKRSAESLAAMAQAEECIAELHAQGLIEPAVVVPAPPPPRPVRPTKPAQNFEAGRRLVVRELNDALGPAAETLAIRIERTRDAAELRAQLPAALEVVTAMRGRSARLVPPGSNAPWPEAPGAAAGRPARASRIGRPPTASAPYRCRSSGSPTSPTSRSSSTS